MSDSVFKLELVRVASVLNPFEAVINRGADDGIRPGQTYLFYAIGPEVMDPVSGESLGQIELVRGPGKVIHVQNRMATVRASRSVPRYASSPFSAGPLAGALGALTIAAGPSHYEDLPFDGITVGDYGKPI